MQSCALFYLKILQINWVSFVIQFILTTNLVLYYKVHLGNLHMNYISQKDMQSPSHQRLNSTQFWPG